MTKKMVEDSSEKEEEEEDEGGGGVPTSWVNTRSVEEVSRTKAITIGAISRSEQGSFENGK